jgi:hypothetical protein
MSRLPLAQSHSSSAFECCDRDVAEITKTHGPLTHCVVTGRTHQAKRRDLLVLLSRAASTAAPAASGGVLKNSRMCWGIGIEIEPGIPNFCEVLACMNPQQRIVIKDSWYPAIPIPNVDPLRGNGSTYPAGRSG